MNMSRNWMLCLLIILNNIKQLGKKGTEAFFCSLWSNDLYLRQKNASVPFFPNQQMENDDG